MTRSLNGLDQPEQFDWQQALDAVSVSRVGRSLRATPYSSVEPEIVRWAWAERVPLGAVTLGVGRQGLGKSTLLASLAADLSRGRLSGDLYGKPTTVLMVNCEDAHETTVVPRLLAADADLDRVIGLDVDEDGRLVESDIEPIGKVSPHSLRRTYASLRAALRDDPVYIAEQLGHRDARFTFRVYQRAAKRRARLTGVHLAAFDRALEWAALSKRAEHFTAFSDVSLGKL